MEKIVSTNLDAVKCVIGQSTKKDNTVTMKVDPRIIIEAVELWESMKKGLKPTSGLLGFKLVAVYAELPPLEEGQKDLDIEIEE
jgi:hypothetical protein